MKIVVTQDIGFTSEQRAKLTKLSSNIKFFDTQPSSGEEWLQRVQGADIICSHIKGLSDSWMDIKNVYLTIPSVSTKFMLKKVFKENNVVLSTSPGCNKIAVSEWVIAMLLRHVRRLNDFVNTTEINEPKPVICNTIYGSRVCVIGKGNIGTEVGKNLIALGAEVIYCTRNYDIYEKIEDKDFVIDCVSENPSTVEMYDKKFFDKLHKRSVFVSVSRAETKNYKDLFTALSKHRFSHYITDNASGLNYDEDDELYKKLLMVGSVSVTPHISAYTETTISESSRICFENIVSYIEGNPQNLAFQE